MDDGRKQTRAKRAVSCPSSSVSRQRGFTLIEILVVVVILAVLAGALTLAIGGAGGERQLAREAEQARALIAYACEQAELSGREIGINIDAKGYRFSRLQHTEWLPANVDELRPRSWIAGTHATLQRDAQQVEIGEKGAEKPQLVCFSSGELTPFRLDLSLTDLTQTYRLEGAPDGNVSLTAAATR